MHATAIIKGFNDVSLEAVLAIYSVWEEYSTKYYIEMLDSDLANPKPLDTKTVERIRNIFVTKEANKVEHVPTISVGKILYCDIKHHIIIWQTMTAKRGQYAIVDDKGVYTVPAKDLLWVYYANTPHIFLYEKWEGRKTIVSPAPLSNVMGRGKICVGTAKFPEFEGDLMKFCKTCEDVYASATKNPRFEIQLQEWKTKGIKALKSYPTPLGKIVSI